MKVIPTVKGNVLGIMFERLSHCGQIGKSCLLDRRRKKKGNATPRQVYDAHTLYQSTNDCAVLGQHLAGRDGDKKSGAES